MTDWSKLKVTDLKDECKARGIPLTGLKLKQHYVDKLTEHDAENSKNDNDDSKVDETAEGEEKTEDPSNTESTKPGDTEPQPDAAPSADTAPTASSAALDSEKLQELQKEDAHAEDAEEKGPKSESEEQQSTEAAAAAAKDALPVPDGQDTNQPNGADKDEIMQDLQENARPDNTADQPPAKESAVIAEQADQADQTEDPTVQPNVAQSGQESPEAAPSNEMTEDERRRRKRSATPVPSSEEVARKKARLSTNEEDLTAEQVSALQEMKKETEVAQETRGETANGAPAEVIVEQPGDDMTVIPEQAQQLLKNNHEAIEASPRKHSVSSHRSRSASEERDIPPAIHPATSSLYIRNFKRPLHIPSLRSHIASIAKSRSSADDSDPVTLFCLDSIRTHAFVSFTSVAAAARVRSAMHDTRYPDEAMREPLFVDFVPDDKVQSWIDQETGGGFGGRGGGGRRFEVVYEEGDDGIEAIFQEVNSSRPQPPPQPSRSSRLSRDMPRSGSDSLPAGVHPDRAAFVPLVDERDRGRDRDRDQDWPVRQPPTGPKNPDLNGRGFKALDELFQYTTTKPKLYYKPVPESVATERLDMFRDLRVGYAHMGRSGDEGMKRYTFELYKGREEWVDKGPEFGFGKRGQERLAGTRPRGGGGGYRGRGGDSWRGSVAR
ncbi:hypothetical protein ABEF93_003475 [Exophiala dermatitidis]